MRRDTFDIISGIAVIVFLLVVIVVCIYFLVKAKENIAEATKPTYIDTTKVQVLYEDTWGKILFVKEEDL